MDIRMPVIDGIEATRRIISANPAIRVLALTTFDLDEYAFGALRAGASGFLLKDVPPANWWRASVSWLWEMPWFRHGSPAAFWRNARQCSRTPDLVNRRRERRRWRS